MIERLHYEIVRGLLHEGACPNNFLVLHPRVAEPWVVHPFWLSPTLHWVEGREYCWWAPCIWCAFGVAAMAGG